MPSFPPLHQTFKMLIVHFPSPPIEQFLFIFMEFVPTMYIPYVPLLMLVFCVSALLVNPDASGTHYRDELIVCHRVSHSREHQY